MLHQKHESYKYVLPLTDWADWTTTKNITTSKMHILGKSAQKLKKAYFPLLATLYNFSLQIETSWAKKAVKPILEIWNSSDVVVYVWFIYSLIKKIYISNVKKNNSKCTKFTINRLK